MGPWSEHGTSWYNCARYEEKGGEKNQDAQSKSRASLERYLHVRPPRFRAVVRETDAKALCRGQYYNRYANHEQSMKLEQELHARTEKKMEEMQEASTLSWIEVQFLSKAVDTLGKCRTVLKWVRLFYVSFRFLVAKFICACRPTPWLSTSPRTTRRKCLRTTRSTFFAWPFCS